MNPSPVLRRVVRRETHSPRTVWAIVVLTVVVALAVWAGTEVVLSLLGLAALIASPGMALAWVVDAPAASPQAAVVAAGAALGLIGLVLVVIALTPGRRPRHRLGGSENVAVVVDNAVVAASLAERARRECDVRRGAVLVGVSHGTADVQVTPEPGQEIDRPAVRDALVDELARYDISPNLRVRLKVRRTADEGGAQ